MSDITIHSATVSSLRPSFSADCNLHRWYLPPVCFCPGCEDESTAFSNSYRVLCQMTSSSLMDWVALRNSAVLKLYAGSRVRYDFALDRGCSACLNCWRCVRTTGISIFCVQRRLSGRIARQPVPTHVVLPKRLNRSKYRLGNGQTRVGPKNRVLDGVHIVAT